MAAAVAAALAGAGLGAATAGGFAGPPGAGLLIDAGGATDDDGVGDEGAGAGDGAGVSVVEDAADVVGGPGSSVGFSACLLSSSPVIGVVRGSQGLRCEILIEGAGFDRGGYPE